MLVEESTPTSSGHWQGLTAVGAMCTVRRSVCIQRAEYKAYKSCIVVVSIVHCVALLGKLVPHQTAERRPTKNPPRIHLTLSQHESDFASLESPDDLGTCCREEARAGVYALG